MNLRVTDIYELISERKMIWNSRKFCIFLAKMIVDSNSKNNVFEPNVSSTKGQIKKCSGIATSDGQRSPSRIRKMCVLVQNQNACSSFARWKHITDEDCA